MRKRTVSKRKRAASKRKRGRGQGMTEYIIIVALVAIGAIAVVTIFGNNIRALFGGSANALTGTSQTNSSTLMQQVDSSQTKKGLNDFDQSTNNGP